MRLTADWMVSKDERILEMLEDEGNLTPKALSRDGKVPRVDISYSYATQRCPLLAKYGLSDEIDQNLYRLSETGSLFLKGDLDASQLEPLPWLADDD